MKLNKLSILAFAGLLGSALTTPTFIHAQGRSPGENTQASAPGQTMQDNDASRKGVLTKADDSIKHMYHATKSELSDAALTTKVKTALLRDDATRKFTIHVKSDRGLVTLAGSVDSAAAAARAQDVASEVKGVQSVNNRLTWHSSAS